MKGTKKMKKTDKRKGKKKMWVAILIAVVAGGGLLAGVLADAPGRREIAELTFAPVDFKNLKDGTYIGEYKGTKSHLRDTKVEVTVSGGEISDIKVLKGAVDKDGKPVKMTNDQTVDDLFGRSVKSQTLQVDVISGATVTSKSHLKALENALMQAQEKQ
ncbi:MAG: FMN-binding domain protein [Firmicutes bacterium ADurb.Bin182]|nr:MAG: FMN-binding domain protein [Firmicutes bacterium ADurb.Bin182]